MSNHVRNVALVGAGGHIGSHILSSLLGTGKHTVTALTRAGSTTSLPAGITTNYVDYDSKPSLVAALTGQDVLIITLSGHAPKDTQTKLVDAAVDAKVPWILPNEWCPELSDAGLVRDVPWFADKPKVREEIAATGVCGYIAIATGFWYEWMMGAGSYGFDFAKKEVTLFDEGNVKISSSTWPQAGRAVAALLSLPVKADGGDTDRCLEHFRNKAIAVSSFAVSQRDMLASVLRVTGEKEAEWTVRKQSSEERYTQGFEALKKQDWSQASKVSARVFYPDGCGNYEDRTVNHLLDLPKEGTDAFDEATKIAIERSKENPYA